jgi:hypothetical protein
LLVDDDPGIRDSLGHTLRLEAKIIFIDHETIHSV